VRRSIVISADEYQEIMKISKQVFDGKSFHKHHYATIDACSKYRVDIASFPDAEFIFFLEIYRSDKNRLRVSLHFQEKNGVLPLLRIDYGSSHRNPETANEHVPSKLRRFCGSTFEINTPHIHYYVQGYKNLSWALPLKEDDFSVKTINCDSDVQNAIIEIATMINLETDLDISIQDEAI